MQAIEFAHKIKLLRQRMAALAESTHFLRRSRAEILKELQDTLEELHVAEEELRQQNEELLAASQALEAQRQCYRKRFDLAPEGYLVTDLEGIIQAVNRVAGVLLNTPAERLTDKPLSVFFAEEQRLSFRAKLAAAAGGVGGQEWEARLQPRQRPPRDVAITVGLTEQDDGLAPGLLWLIRDISARKRGEEQIRALNATLERRVEERTAALVAANQAKDQLLLQEQQARAASVTTQQRLNLLVQASGLLASSLDYPATLSGVARLALPYLGESCIIYLTTPDGAIRPLVVADVDPAREQLARERERLCPLHRDDPDGVPRVLRTGRVELAADLATEPASAYVLNLREQGMQSVLVVPLRTRSQTLGALAFSALTPNCYGPPELLLTEDLARRVVVAIEHARCYRDLCEADRRKDEFLAMLGHELRNPLTPICNALSIQRLCGADPDLKARAQEMIERQVQHLTQVVDGLVDVSRLTHGRIELHRERIDVATIAARAVEDTQPLLEAHGHQLVLALPTQPVSLEADPLRLAQVFVNLLTNAIKYTGRGGRIDFRIERTGNEVVVRVKDTGIGIAAELLPRVFDVFTQGERSLDRPEGGLGIGLALVRKVVELHGGSIDAFSDGVGKGSEFVVTLPLSGNAAESPQLAQPNPLAATRVLVVDDERDVAESLTQLVQLWGYEVRTAYDGPSALEEARQQRPEAVLLDIGLPGMDGYEVARRLRGQPGLEHVLLVAVTSYGQDEDRRRSSQAGFNHHLVKPVDPEVLRAVLSANKGEGGAS